MIATLKSLAVAGRHHSILNGKISTFLEYLFENSFLPSLRWSDVPGKSTEERIKLVDYSSVIGLFKSAASENVDGVIQFPKIKK
ncbi:hypothetical protein PVAND_002244 [Polypedilum vanderplanki]|uniref:Uncharacterized protein n=1 Tax=Polypedilum vanderplanki TaxID=319348 RepID=A0A9J6BQE0_POLVA|nr:hypothetical protein PVAND_002244 [Polypedilum vanderplanki]